MIVIVSTPVILKLYTQFVSITEEHTVELNCCFGLVLY